jgi:hypothetical protein
MLHTRVLYGKAVIFSGIQESATSPIWLDSQHILYLSIVNGTGQLAQLIQPQE